MGPDRYLPFDWVLQYSASPMAMDFDKSYNWNECFIDLSEELSGIDCFIEKCYSNLESDYQEGFNNWKLNFWFKWLIFY